MFELQHQLSRLNILVERGNQVLQQKAQVRSTVQSVQALCVISNEDGKNWQMINGNDPVELIKALK